MWARGSEGTNRGDIRQPDRVRAHTVRILSPVVLPLAPSPVRFPHQGLVVDVCGAPDAIDAVDEASKSRIIPPHLTVEQYHEMLVELVKRGAAAGPPHSPGVERSDNAT
jgi:hypothetical protein